MRRGWLGAVYTICQSIQNHSLSSVSQSECAMQQKIRFISIKTPPGPILHIHHPVNRVLDPESPRPHTYWARVEQMEHGIARVDIPVFYSCLSFSKMSASLATSSDLWHRDADTRVFSGGTGSCQDLYLWDLYLLFVCSWYTAARMHIAVLSL